MDAHLWERRLWVQMLRLRAQTWRVLLRFHWRHGNNYRQRAQHCAQGPARIVRFTSRYWLSPKSITPTFTDFVANLFRTLSQSRRNGIWALPHWMISGRLDFWASCFVFCVSAGVQPQPVLITEYILYDGVNNWISWARISWSSKI